MTASSYGKSSPANACGLPRRPGVVEGPLVAWAKLFALWLSLFFYPPVVVPLLLLARTRAGQLMAILVTLLAFGPTLPELQREVPSPGLHRPETGTHSTLAPAEDLARVAGPRELAGDSPGNTARQEPRCGLQSLKTLLSLGRDLPLSISQGRREALCATDGATFAQLAINRTHVAPDPAHPATLSPEHAMGKVPR